VAEAVAMCRPQVICAYPITPQTHIVEALSAMVKKEELAAEFLILVPCPLGWGSSPADTVKVARLATESGLFPVFEAEAGQVTSSAPIRHQVPVTDYLRLQARYAHLFRPQERTEVIARIQASADRNIVRFGLLSQDPDTQRRLGLPRDAGPYSERGE
jgi:hypothetical protein